MKKNLGSSDRIIRALVAVVFVALSASGVATAVWGIVFPVVSAILLTSVTGICPLYVPFRLDTLNKARIKP